MVIIEEYKGPIVSPTQLAVIWVEFEPLVADIEGSLLICHNEVVQIDRIVEAIAEDSHPSNHTATCPIMTIGVVTVSVVDFHLDNHTVAAVISHAVHTTADHVVVILLTCHSEDYTSVDPLTYPVDMQLLSCLVVAFVPTLEKAPQSQIS